MYIHINHMHTQIHHQYLVSEQGVLKTAIAMIKLNLKKNSKDDVYSAYVHTLFPLEALTSVKVLSHTQCSSTWVRTHTSTLSAKVQLSLNTPIQFCVV